MIDFLTKNQQKVAIFTGYIIVFMLAFGLGRVTVLRPDPPEIRIEEPDSLTQANSSGEIQGAQSQNSPAGAAPPAVESSPQSAIPGFAPVAGSCSGHIKGSSSKIYHLPGGAFYDRTTKPARCFYTTAEAESAGFRKSAR